MHHRDEYVLLSSGFDFVGDESGKEFIRLIVGQALSGNYVKRLVKGLTSL